MEDVFKMKGKGCVFTRSGARRKGLNRWMLLLSGTMKLMLPAFLVGLLWCTVFPGAADATDVTVAREAGKRIAAGYNHSLALKPDGTAEAWGNNTYGQCDTPADGVVDNLVIVCHSKVILYK